MTTFNDNKLLFRLNFSTTHVSPSSGGPDHGLFRLLHEDRPIKSLNGFFHKIVNGTVQNWW